MVLAHVQLQFFDAAKNARFLDQRSRPDGAVVKIDHFGDGALDAMAQHPGLLHRLGGLARILIDLVAGHVEERGDAPTERSQGADLGVEMRGGALGARDGDRCVGDVDRRDLATALLELHREFTDRASRFEHLRTLPRSDMFDDRGVSALSTVRCRSTEYQGGGNDLAVTDDPVEVIEIVAPSREARLG